MNAALKEIRTSNPVAQFLSAPKKLLIGGKWVAAASGKTFQVMNPATGEVIAHAAEGDKADMEAAVIAARRAFETGAWPALTPSDRAKIIWRIGDLITKYARNSRSLSRSTTASRWRSQERPTCRSLRIFPVHGGLGTKIEGKTHPLSVLYTPGVHYHSYTRREPIGVVGQIIPWNFPLLMAAWKLAPALATGCTLVLKVPRRRRFRRCAWAKLSGGGLPAGVVNIVRASATAGAALAAHPGVDKVAFTGSTEVGKLIVKAAAHD